jgi:hypothetical protein
MGRVKSVSWKKKYKIPRTRIMIINSLHMISKAVGTNGGLRTEKWANTRSVPK